MCQSSQTVHSSNTYCVLIESIGRGTPASAAAVAKGLGRPASEVVRCLYTAPAVLVEKVDRNVAEQLNELLESIGYEARVVEMGGFVQETPELYDISLYLQEASKLTTVANKLSKFIGLSESDAVQALLNPPGVVLGSVSRATVAALEALLDGDADLLACPQNKTLYDVFVGELPEVIRRRLLDDLKSRGIPLLGESGLVASSIEISRLEDIWQRYKANAGLKVVNQAFLRFDIQLDSSVSDLTDAQIDCFRRNTDIPENLLAQVVQAAPVTIIESLPKTSLDRVLDDFYKTDIPVSAHLITFQSLGLKVINAQDLSYVNEVLDAFSIGETLQEIPATLPCAFPEIQARVIRRSLESAGATVELVSEL
ncbi:hypothetical protein M3P05_17330 [Sansalvadorimonas sp. 2012CJ34-2]|uniref:Uncharacterized protein n=1 Tax=Parendozoicomonas callyspongiae TaxID=2942213 RepID=A0ABT0PJY7_9GAMM|nr:hypothetical protein [Sansalvadorimonas sp. 2012CJ34-2]MCL6271683.1 hypothetical protein [Sansalvadorimonas sp. 2012CJ34-2]